MVNKPLSGEIFIISNMFQVYTKDAIREVVKFGLEHGVRVLPEFDAPAHVGEGWQDTDLTVCFKVLSEGRHV